MLLNIPVSYVFLRNGAAAEITVAVAIAISLVCLAARLVMLRRMIGLSIRKFVMDVLLKILLVVVTSLILPLALYKVIPDGFAGFIVSAAVCVAVSGLTVLLIGLDGNERKELFAMIMKGGKR